MEIFLYVIIFLDLKTINAFIQLDSYQSYLFLFFDFLSQLKAFLKKFNETGRLKICFLAFVYHQKYVGEPFQIWKESSKPTCSYKQRILRIHYLVRNRAC